ncbi:MAG: hypothetical protein WAR79_01245 [Melioribacteraceae bacterium]
MLSINECKENLKSGKERYSDEEIKIIRELLYHLADIEMKIRQQQQLSNN